MAAISNRIEYAADHPPSFLARWASRLALFCVLLLFVATFLHRVLSLPTPIALNLAGASFTGALAAAGMAAIAGLDIWVTGRQGAARVVTALVMSAALLALPVTAIVVARDFPMITDVTTDVADPPQFETAAAVRAEGSNPLSYDKDANAAAQQEGYPDIKTLVVPRSPGDTFEAVLQALTKLKLKLASEEAPADATDGVGRIELTDTTLFLGFRDDVVIRVKGNEDGSSVDVRSSSRYGTNDFGRNAARVRLILKEIVGRLEATMPVRKPAPADAQAGAAKVKRPAASSRPSAAPRPRPAPSRPARRRAPEPSASPPG